MLESLQAGRHSIPYYYWSRCNGIHRREVYYGSGNSNNLSELDVINNVDLPQTQLSKALPYTSIHSTTNPVRSCAAATHKPSRRNHSLKRKSDILGDQLCGCQEIFNYTLVPVRDLSSGIDFEQHTLAEPRSMADVESCSSFSAHQH